MDSTPLLRARSRARRIEGFLASIPFWALALCSVLIMAVKVGPNFAPLPEGAIERDVWPQPSGHIGGSSYGMRGLIIGLGLEGFREIAILGIVLLGLYFAVITFTAHKLPFRSHNRLILLLTLGGPTSVVLLSSIGRYDVFLLAGAWMIAISVWLPKSRVWAVVGISLCLLGNPEQFLVASAFLVLLSRCEALPQYKGVAGWSLGVSIFAVLSTTLWTRALDIPSRFTYWPEYVNGSWSNFAPNTPLVLYSGLTVMWVIVLIGFLISDHLGQFAIAIILLIATVITATTLDQTRVLVGITALPLSALLLEVVKQIRADLPRDSRLQNLLLPAAVLVLLLPAFEVDQSGEVRSPYAWLLYLWETGLSWGPFS